jgi:MerR family copper efflux transcriptional regulator
MLQIPVNWNVKYVKIIIMEIADFSKLTGVPKKTLRYWEDIGILPAANRAPNGYRSYTTQHFNTVNFIKSAKTLGLTLGEIKSVIKLKENDKSPCQYVYELLIKKANQIDETIENLKAIKKELEKLIKRASTLNLEKCQENEVCHIIPSKN